MPETLRILLLEDSETDARLVVDTLEAEGIPAAVERVDDRAGFEAALERGGFHVVVSDFRLPAFDGLAALDLARARRPDAPFILFSGTMGEEVAVDALRAGATDYVLKERPRRLGASVRRALAEAEEHRRRRDAERALGTALVLLERSQEIAHVGSFELDRVSGRLTWSREARRILGLDGADPAESLDAFLADLGVEDGPATMAEHERSVRDGTPGYERELRVGAKRGGGAIVLLRCQHVHDASGAVIRSIGVLQDVTEQRRSEEALRLHAAALQARNEELARFNRVAVGRELRMVELKREVNALCRELGRREPYGAGEPDGPDRR